MKTKHQIIIIIVLSVVFIIETIFYIKGIDTSSSTTSQMPSGDISQIPTESTTSTTNENSTTDNSSTILTTTSQILSALTEKVELHATYYLEECFVEENQEVKQGEKILEYTNGNYLTAPYDCVIISLNIPSVEGKCTNSHYIEISSSNLMAVKLNVDETLISKISVGDSATITIPAFDDKTVTGYVTKVSNTASNGKFSVTVEFDNEMDIRIGMTANVTL